MPRAIGLMSGTSLDGVSAALIETDGTSIIATGPALTLPYDPLLRADLRRLLDLAPGLANDDARLADATRRLTIRHVEAVRALGHEPGYVPAELIGFHGQTILHRPAEHRTWQIGDPVLLARQTGLPVAWDFRSADVAAGGEGAPLVPIYHAALAASLPKPLCLLNLGGVANLTYIDDGVLLACDTGPGNALLDDWALRHTGRPCDVDGALARAGHVHEDVLEKLLAHPFFRRPPPKSLDRLDFHIALDLIAGLSPQDGAATLTEFTARAVASTPLPSPPRRWLVCGGGRHNRSLMQALHAALQAPVDPAEAQNWDGDAIEAQCFGLLAVRCAGGLPITFPGTTGAPRPLPGGYIVAPV